MVAKVNYPPQSRLSAHDGSPHECHAKKEGSKHIAWVGLGLAIGGLVLLVAFAWIGSLAKM